jgi:guanosine-3',5'-bis(diphosphate) 3'-pyrophosphohydrolase
MAVDEHETSDHTGCVTTTLPNDALKFATERHSGQTRKDGVTPFIRHPIAVASRLMTAGVRDEAVIAAAFLHDVVEDTEATLAEVEERFGARVASLVAEVSDDKSLSQAERKRLEVEHTASASEGARLIKVADKTENLIDILERPAPGWSVERQAAYFEFARRVVEAASDVHGELVQGFLEVYGKGKERWQLS